MSKFVGKPCITLEMLLTRTFLQKIFLFNFYKLNIILLHDCVDILPILIAVINSILLNIIRTYIAVFKQYRLLTCINYSVANKIHY